MLGKIPLVKGFHVIFTKFHDCVLHIRTPWSLQSVQNLSLSVAVNVDFRGYLQVLHWHYSTPLKTFQMVNS